MKDKLEFNEENQINLVVEKDGLKREIFYHGKPIQELIKYKDMWQKLKEFISNRPDCAGYDIKHNGYQFLFDILDKIQELEGEDE